MQKLSLIRSDRFLILSNQSASPGISYHASIVLGLHGHLFALITTITGTSSLSEVCQVREDPA